MVSADFCPNLSQRVTSQAAMFSYPVRNSCQLIAYWHAWAWYPGGPTGSYHRNKTSHDKQISPDKNMNFRSTTASFTPWDRIIQRGEPYPMNPGLCYHVPTYPRTRPSMMFLFVGSLLCYLSRGIFFYPTGQASFPQSLAALQLPFANNCCTFK